jgi:hypothetical protein
MCKCSQGRKLLKLKQKTGNVKIAELMPDFCTCEQVRDRLPPRLTSATFAVGCGPQRGKICRDLMDENVQKSCWSVTLWTVGAVGIALAMVLLFNDVDNAQQAVAIAK